MELKTKLLMSFKTDDEKKVSFSVDDPKPGVTEEEIVNVMNLILEKDLFSPKGATLVALAGARIVATDTTEYDLIF